MILKNSDPPPDVVEGDLSLDELPGTCSLLEVLAGNPEGLGEPFHGQSQEFLREHEVWFTMLAFTDGCPRRDVQTDPGAP